MPQFPIHNSPHFDCREFVDARSWNLLAYLSQWMIDPKIVRCADLVREISGVPVTINNWHFAKPGQTVYVASGFRAVWEKTGGTLSQHRRGCAADLKVRGMKPGQVFALIMENSQLFVEAGLTTLEDLVYTPSWNHLDTRARIAGIHPADRPFLIVAPV